MPTFFASQHPTIQITTPAFTFSNKNLEEQLFNRIESMFDCTILRPLKKSPYLSYDGSHSERADELISAISNPDVDVIWPLLGGIGCAQIMDEINRRNITLSGTPKLLVGFSDIVLIGQWWQRQGWPFLHGAVSGLNDVAHELTSIAMNKEASLAELFSVIKGEKTSLNYSFNVIYSPKQSEALHGHLTGGATAIVRESIGVKAPIATDNSFLFVENYAPMDPSIVLRNFIHFIQAGLLKEAHALVLGDLQLKSSRLNNKVATEYFYQELSELVKANCPHISIIQSDEFGHAEMNRPLPFGVPATITIDGNSSELLIEL